MTDDIQNVLGRIETKIDGLGERMDRQNDHLFGRGGVEARLRLVEIEQAVIRGKAGVISAIISAMVAAVVSFFHWGNK